MTESNESVINITAPTEREQLTYQITSGLFGIFEIYLFVSLLLYELFVPYKHRNGKKLRILGLCTTMTAILYAIFQQFLVIFASKSSMLCLSVCGPDKLGDANSGQLLSQSSPV